MLRLLTAGLGLGLILSSCGSGGTPPSVAILTPISEATVTGTTAVQVTLDTQETGTVTVYARARGGTEEGRLIGTVNTSPYIVTWNTASLPAGADLELYAKATVKGATGTSPTVPVIIQNASSPALQYMVAYNIPKSSLNLQSQGTQRQLPPLDPAHIALRDIGASSTVPRHSSLISTQAIGADRQLAVEWAWSPVDGADGYRVLRSDKSVAGPFSVVANIAATAAGAARQTHTQFISAEDAKDVGSRVFGAVRSLSGVAQTESATSAAGRAVFMDEQLVASPVKGQVVEKGQPVLTWTALPGATGYLYFLCDRPCGEQKSQFLWTNPLNGGKYVTTTQLSAAYPSAREPLPRGTYHWWVAGVRQEGDRVVSLSYSESRTLVVP
ncbi:hypothetical protein DGo_PF0022 (plasmid) [Deinococcus gobiensis I-0]|uniref:Lipoprotein n=1 Tax=Deinococcus gobiensis (strain DSM 21396 / JCM 16679 / CGMCC 1.7299 / I-0) TaxID=745776 RepID=H8H3Z8_DEIGI|nr:hypothetical protein DGo_PF0022 [Deinococcus gobiensis I-0]